jgi:5'-nucleotidase (lipoprotein e(P4) family)
MAEGFTLPDTGHLLLRGDEKTKEPRRKAISQSYHISLLIGDNLTDFSDIFEMKDPYRRIAITDSLQKEFGRRFIILPNAMYGDWENAIYKYRFNLPESEKTLSRYNYLEGF